MIRVTYIEEKFDCLLEASEIDADTARKEAELESIGPLFF
jgi:hypothetical protein